MVLDYFYFYKYHFNFYQFATQVNYCQFIVMDDISLNRTFDWV